MSLLAKDFRIFSYQTSLFTVTGSFVTNKILSSMLSKFSKNFDGNPVVLPLPSDTPPGIPRIILQSKDDSLKLEISPSRINIFCNLVNFNSNIDIDFYFDLFLKIFEDYLTASGLKVGRLASVSTKFKKDDNPGLTLAKYFCKQQFIDNPLKRPEKFELHAFKKYNFNNFKVNSWIRFKTGILTLTKESIILVEQDINTLAEEMEKRLFSINEIETFQNFSKIEHEQILEKYLING